MAVFVTGDIHSHIDRILEFGYEYNLTEEDYIIVCGDFGVVWYNDKFPVTSSFYDYAQKGLKKEKESIDKLTAAPWTTLFVDGNHENFNRLYSLPVETWNGGKVHKLSPKVMHLMRGEIFNIDGRTYLAMGGAESHDIDFGIVRPSFYDTEEEMLDACREIERTRGNLYRIEGISWWKQEVPTREERKNCLENLARHDYKVDYIITHEVPSTTLLSLFHFRRMIPTEYSTWLNDEVKAKVEYRDFFSGHYHTDEDASPKDHICYTEFTIVE